MTSGALCAASGPMGCEAALSLNAPVRTIGKMQTIPAGVD